MNQVSSYCPCCGSQKKSDPQLEAGVFYMYTVYLLDPGNLFKPNNTTSAAFYWDSSVTVMAKTPEQAVLNLDPQYKSWYVVKIDGPEVFNLNGNQITGGIPIGNQTLYSFPIPIVIGTSCLENATGGYNSSAHGLHSLYPNIKL